MLPYENFFFSFFFKAAHGNIFGDSLLYNITWIEFPCSKVTYLIWFDYKYLLSFDMKPLCAHADIESK